MAQSIEVPVSLGLQQAESQVNHLRKILNEAVKIDSTAFRGLSQALQKAENDVAKLKSQMSTAFQSASGSKKFLSDYDKLFESLATIGNRFGFLKESEMIFSPENAEAIKNARTEMAQLSDEIQQIKSGKVGKLFEDDSVESIRQVREVANELGVTLSKTTFQDFSQKISGAMTETEQKIAQTTKQIEALKAAANNANFTKDSIFSQASISKLMGNTTEVVDKNGAKTLREQISKLYESYGLTGIDLGKSIKAGSNVDQLFSAEEERVRASSEKYVGVLQEAKTKIQEEINKFDEGIKQSGGEGQRANWESKLAYIEGIKQKFSGLLTFSDTPASVAKNGTGITKYVENFKQELINGLQNLSTSDITRELQIKVQEIFSNVSKHNVITDASSFKTQVETMLQDAFGSIDLTGLTEGIKNNMNFEDAIDRILSNVRVKFASLDSSELENKVEEYRAALAKLHQANDTVNATEQSSTGALKEKEAAFQALAEKVTQYVAAQLGITTGQVQQVLRGDTDAANQGRTALEGYIQSLNKLTQKQQALGNIQSAVNRWMGFWQVLNMTKSAINEMKQHIQELDSVMTSISVVTNFSQEDLWGQISQYSEIARQYGVAIKGVYEVSQIYYQQGLQQNDVMTLTTETLKMARIAGLDYATAADYMTTAIRGFKLEMTDAAHVTDVFSALAATTASSTEEIAVAISKTAASAEAVGASFEATSAMMATMIATTRESATNIGTALKSVISRYGEMTSDPSKTVDSEGEEMSLNRVDKALQTVGITIHDTAGQFRDFDDVMLELMEKWDSLDSLSQRYIATLMAGNRQQSRFLALVSNVDEYKKALETAMDSEGTGELQTLKTLDSIDAKIEKMKVTIQEFYTSSGLEELYKGVLDGITNIVSAANSLPKAFGKIPVQALAVGMSIVNVIKSVITLIISEIQAGLQQIQGKAANTFEGLIIQAAAQGEEIGKAVKTGIERGADGAGSTIGSQLKGIILRNVGAIASLVGSALTLKGFNEYGASTSEKTDRLAGVQTFSGGLLGVAGSAISGAATGAAMGSAAGPGGVAIGAVLGGVKGLISNFATLASGIDMMNVTLARQIELSKKRVESAQEEELRAKNSEKNLSQAVEKLKELEEHRYDSIESEKEYYDYMAQLADSYPEYINSINEAGNAIIHSTDLETALASAREITAQKTLAATEAELEQSKLQLEAYKNFNSNLATLGETSDILEIGFQAAKKYGTGNQVYERLFTAYNMAHPESTIDIGTANTWQAENKARDLWTADPQIREQILAWAREEGFTRPTSDNDKKNDFIQALDNIISESDNELNYKQLTGGLAEDAAGIRKLTSEQLQQAISRATNMAQDYIDSQSAAIDNITKLYTQEQFDQKVLTSLSKEDQASKTILDQYKNLLSFGLNAQFAGMDIKDIPADQWEQAFSNLSQWIINNQDAALALMNIDYSQYIDAEEIKKSIPNYEGLDENIRAEIEKNLNDTRTTAITLYESQLNSIFGEGKVPSWLSDNTNKFTTRTLSAIQSDLKQYQSFIEKQQYAQAEAYLNNMEAIYGPKGIGSLSGENQTKAYDIIKDLDLSDPEALHSAAETFAGMGSDFEGLSEIFTSAALRWTTNAATLLEQLASATKDTAKSIESSLSDMSKVFKYSEALEKAQTLMDANKGVKFDQLFTYDKDLGGYVKTAKAFQLEMAEFQNQQVEGIQQAITDTTITLPKALKSLNYDRLAMDYTGSKNTNQNIAQRSVKEGKQTLSSLTGITDSATLDRLWMQYTQMMQEFDALKETDKDWNTFVDKYIQEHGEALQLQLDEINNMSSQMASLELESFDYASIVSGKGTVQNKESMQALLTQAIDPAKFKLNQERFNEEYAKLITGDLDSWNTYIDELNTKTGSKIAHADEGQANRARFESLTSLYQKIASGDVIWDALTQQEQELLNSVEGVNLTEGASAASVGAAADNVWAAIIKLINAGAGTLNEVADTIAGKADKDFKDSNAGKQYNLLTSYKDGFTSQEAQELGLLDDNGKLKAEFSSYLERDSNGNWVAQAGQNAASVIQNLAHLLNISIDKTTDEYKDAIKEGIDQAIAEADKADIGKQRVNAWQSIMSGKVTDRISLANVDNTTKSYMKAAGLISDMNADFVYIQSEEQLNNAIEWMRSKLSDQSFVQGNQQTARYFQQLVSDFESKTAKNAAFEGIVGEQFNQSAAEALSMALQNTTEYSKVQSLMTEMGFKWDQAAQVWKASAESIARARAKITSAWGHNEISDEEYWNLIAQLNETADAINPKTKQDNTILDMLSNYTSATEAMRAAFNTNFMSEMIAQGAQVTDFFKANDNGTYDIDVGALKSFLDSIGFEYDEAAMSQIQTITDSYLNNIKTATTYTTQGASSLADVDAFKQSYADIVGKTLSDDAFSYNSVLQSFVLDESYMDEYINAQREKLRQLNYSEEFIEQYIKDQTDRAIQDSIALDGFLNATTSTERNDEANKLIQQIRGLSNYKDLFTQDSSLIQKLKDHHFDEDSFSRDWEQYQEQYDLLILETLESGGQAAVDLLKQIKPKASSDELEAVYNNAINKLRTAQEDLGKGVGETIGGMAASIGTTTGALEVEWIDDGTAVITAVHNMVGAYAAIYKQMKETAGHTTADLNSAYVDMLNAEDASRTNILEALKNGNGMSYEALGEIFTSQNKLLEDALLNEATAMQYGLQRDFLGQVRIVDWKKFASQVFNEEDLDSLRNNPQYIDAFKAYNDGLIELNKNAKDTILEEVNSLKDMKRGDWINLASLDIAIQQAMQNSIQRTSDMVASGTLIPASQANEKLNMADNLYTLLDSYGATLEDGILKIRDQANLFGIATTLQQMINFTDIDFGEDFAQIEDAIHEILSSYSEAIKKGIQGGLSNVEAADLQAKAYDLGLGEIHFEKTTEGLKLAQASAIELYQTISKIDNLQGQLVFDELSKSLAENNENFTSTNALLSHMVDLRKKLAGVDGEISDARRKQYEAELEVAKEIVAVRSGGEDDSFNFMDNDIPGGQKNMINYAKNWSEAMKAINDAYKVKNTKYRDATKNTATGYMDYTDFYNIVNELNNMAGLMGKTVTVGKTIQGEALTLDGSLESASALITKGIETITAVDTGDMMVNIGALGINLSKGASDLNSGIQDGIKEVAKAQISALDGMIAMLELIVAMESLGDIAGKDMTIDLPDIVVDDDNDGKFDRLTDKYKDWLTKFDQLYETNEDIRKVVDGININGMTWRDWLKRDAKEWSNADAQILDALYQAAISTDWNLDDIGGSLQKLLNSGKFGELTDSFTIDIGDITYTISNGAVVEVADWSNEQTQNVLTQYKKATGKDDQHAKQDIISAIESYLNGKGTGNKDIEIKDVIKIKHASLIKHDESGDYIEGPNGERYAEGSAGWNKAIQATTLRDQAGVGDKSTITYDEKAKTSSTTVEYGQTYKIQMKAKVDAAGNVVWETGDLDFSQVPELEGFEPSGKATSQSALLTEMYNYATTKSTNAKANLAEFPTQESWIYQRFGIHLKINTEVYKDGNQVEDPTKDPKFREDAKSIIQDVKEKGINAIEKMASNGEGKTTIQTTNGYTIQLDTDDISYDGKNINENLLAKKLEEVVGIDGALKDTISSGIKDAFMSLPEAINSIEPSNITSVSDALNGITTALAAVVEDTNWDTLIAKLQEVASAASGIKLPTGGNGSETPASNRIKKKFKTFAEKIKQSKQQETSSEDSSSSYRVKKSEGNQEEAVNNVQVGIDKVNAAVEKGVQTLTTTGTNAGTAVTEALSSAATAGLNTLSEGITEAVDSVIKSYTDLETRTEQVAGTIRSHWEALVDQITSAVSLIQSLVQSLQEKISITWTIGSEGGKSDLAGSGSGVDLDSTRGVTALTEYMDKMLSTIEHNKKDDTFKVTMPTLTIDTSTTKVNIDDIGTKVQEEAAKEPVKEVKVSVGTITADLDNVNVDVASINEKVKTETKANPIPSLDTLVNSITPDLTGTTVNTTGINTKVQAEVAKNPIPNLDVVVNTITPDVSEATPADIEVFPKPLIIKSAKAKIEKLADPLDLTEINDLGVQKLNENASMVLTDVKAVPTSLSLSLDSASKVSIDKSTPVVLSEPIKIPAELDATSANASITELETKISGIKQEKIPNILVNIVVAIGILSDLQKEIDKIKQKKIPQITVDTEDAKNSLYEILGILNTIIENAQSLMIKITTAQETYQTSELIKTIMNNLIMINLNKIITISIGGGDWQKLISDLNAIAKALERIKGASGIDIDINGGPKETPEEGETPKEGETPQEKQSTTTTEVSQQTKVTTPNGTEIEMNAKVVATEVDGSQAPPMDAQANVTSASMASGAQPLQTAAEVNSAEAAQGTTVAIQASIEMGDAGQNLQLTATYTATVVNQPADANNLKANYQAIVTGAPGNIHGLKAYYTAVLERGLGGCFVAGTQITMADGTTKNIENIQVGDQVISYNTTTNEFVIGIVNKAYVHHNTSELIKVLLSDETSIILTPGHPLLSTRGWKSRDIENSLYEHNTIATWLNIGDILIKQDHNASVISIENINVPEHYDTYNAEVNVYHTFIANGIVAHNRKASADAINATGNFGLASGTFGLASDTLGRITGPAHAQSTLMGELGPELVISDGRYFVVGQDGAEMVDLDEDAIVFNHLQTEQLLKNGMSKGRGRAVTNERNAVAFAKGNVDGGPAMASASAALAALKQIRSMWQSLLTASVKDLAGAGGSGGGGGGGSGDKGGSDPGTKSFIEQVERWYNLMQEIAKLEKVINHEETLRAKLESDLYKNGKAYYKSQKESLSAIQGSIVAQEKLNLSRREFFNQRREELNNDNGPFTQLYEFDPQGQLKYKEPTNIRGSSAQNGYAFLADLMKQHDTGKAKYTVEEQYKILEQAGFSEYMKYDSSGNEIKLGGEGEHKKEDYDTYYSSMVQAFWDRVEAQKSEMQTLYDAIAEGENNLLELEQQRNDLLQEMYDNQRDLEDSVLSAIEDMRQREIDALQDERDKLEEATGKYIDGLSEALDKERQMYDTQENQNELDTKKRRLGILQRSGASAEDIYSLQKEITESEKNMYFDAQQAQIDAIQQASDLEIERLDTQIQIMQDTLDFQKEMGLLWYKVYDVMGKSSAEITNFVMGNDSQFWAKSPLESKQHYEDTLFSAQKWESFAGDTQDFIRWSRNSQTADALSTYSQNMASMHGQDWDASGRYSKVFEETFQKTGDRTKAAVEASKLFEADAEWRRREQEGGAEFIGTGDEKYVDIDDNQHWKYTYRHEVYGGNNPQYMGQTNYYFVSKVKENHNWVNGVCSKCGHQQPPNSRGGGGWSSNNCSDNCSGVCKGQLSGGDNRSTGAVWIGQGKGCMGCKGQCSGGCTNTCKGSSNAVGGKFVPKKASGGFVSHGLYELGEQGTETVFTAQQTRVLRNNILSNKPSSLVSLLKTYNEGFSMNQRYGLLKSVGERMSSTTNNTSGGITIENATVNMNVQKIANDYDAKRAGEQALNEMLRIANKTSAANNIRR